MTHFLKLPNLPKGKVAVVAVGEDYADIISSALAPFEIETLICPNNSLVDARLRSHIDLSVFHLGGNEFVLPKQVAYSAFADKLIRLGAEIKISNSDYSPLYPNDAFLCALSSGSRLFHNRNVCDPIIKEFYANRFIHVNQGYAKCAVCLVNENAAICSDLGLIKAMKNVGMDVLEVAATGIVLKGFNEGFLGGASFKIAPDKLAFTGNLHSHPNEDKIIEFLQLHGITPIFLTDNPIFDIGSAIPITEF